IIVLSRTSGSFANDEVGDDVIRQAPRLTEAQSIFSNGKGTTSEAAEKLCSGKSREGHDFSRATLIVSLRALQRPGWAFCGTWLAAVMKFFESEPQRLEPRLNGSFAPRAIVPLPTQLSP